MWIVCLADNSHKTPRLIFYEKKKKKKKIFKNDSCCSCDWCFKGWKISRWHILFSYFPQCQIKKKKKNYKIQFKHLHGPASIPDQITRLQDQTLLKAELSSWLCRNFRYYIWISWYNVKIVVRSIKHQIVIKSNTLFVSSPEEMSQRMCPAIFLGITVVQTKPCVFNFHDEI